MTLRDVLSKPSTSPATPVELKATCHLVKHLMQQGEGSSSSITVQSPRGQVFFCNTVQYKNMYTRSFEIANYLGTSARMQSPHS